jgi:hypothetical protein
MRQKKNVYAINGKTGWEKKLLERRRSRWVDNLKVGCLHPVACTRSGSGFPSNATLV